MTTTTLQHAADLIERAARIALVTIHRPDGDRIASLVALARALETMKKTVRLVLPDPLSRPFLHLPVTYAIRPTLRRSHHYTIRIPLKENTDLCAIEYERRNRSLFVHLQASAALPNRIAEIHSSQNAYDLIIVVGSNTLEDISVFHDDPDPFFQTPLLSLSTTKNSGSFAGCEAIVSGAATLAEVATALLERIANKHPDTQIIDVGAATSLLAGLLLGTTHSHHAMSPGTHETAARLLRYGANRATVSTVIQQQRQPLQILRLMGSILQHCSFDHDRNLLSAHLPHGIRHDEPTLRAVTTEFRKQFPDAAHFLLSWENPHEEHPAAPRRLFFFSSTSDRAQQHVLARTRGLLRADGVLLQAPSPSSVISLIETA